MAIHIDLDRAESIALSAPLDRPYQSMAMQQEPKLEVPTIYKAYVRPIF